MKLTYLKEIFPTFISSIDVLKSYFISISTTVKKQSKLHKICSILYSLALTITMMFIATNSVIILKVIIFTSAFFLTSFMMLLISSFRNSVFRIYKLLFIAAYSFSYAKIAYDIADINNTISREININHIFVIGLLFLIFALFLILRTFKQLLHNSYAAKKKWAEIIIDFLYYFSPWFSGKKLNIKKTTHQLIISTSLVLISTLFLTTAYILYLEFPSMKIESISFTLTYLNNSVSPRIVGEISIYALADILITILFFLSSVSKENFKLIWPSICLLCLSFNVLLMQSGLFTFITHQLTDSHIYQNYYIKPDDYILEFPDNKKNLIYIYLESYENTFTSKKRGGNQNIDYIPELADLASSNINFSNTSGLGGQTVFYPNISYTMGSTVAQTSGIPLTTPLGLMKNNLDSLSSFLPSLRRLEDVLYDAGYNQLFIRGEDTNFAGYNHYVGRYNNSKIFDWNTAVEKKYVSINDKRSWGFEDKKLFSFSKELITDLASDSKPFCVTLYTVDTHSCEQGYRCELCDPNIHDRLTAAIRCSSKQTSNFVKWISEQDFYKDTVIIITGDHLVERTTNYIDFESNNYKRTTYNCIINSDKTPSKEKNRIFSATDMFPTTLSAIGVTIKGDRLGLGTDLFSDRPTLCEELGEEQYLKAVQSHSKYYNENFWSTKK